MASTTGLDAAHVRSLNGLYAAVADLAQSGSPVPCTRSNWQAWTSDDAESQEFAAMHCSACPVITQCREHIDTFPEKTSVWAGMTPTERTKQK